MKTPVKIAIVAALAVSVGAALAFKLNKDKAPAEKVASAAVAGSGATAKNPGAPDAPPAAVKLPKLIDLGAGKCIPCKMMKPILDELKRDYASRFITEFIDVWENREAGKPYNIEMIPTQIFFDAAGKELFRHTGFYGKDDILAKWKELGVDLKPVK